MYAIPQRGWLRHQLHRVALYFLFFACAASALIALHSAYLVLSVPT